MSGHPMTHGNEPSGIAPTRADTRRLRALAAVLIVLGVIGVVARSTGIDLRVHLGEQSWPLLVMLPGLGLLAVAFTRTPPGGLGFAIAGSVVTAIGAILLVQANTGAWASWAYVWALIPAAAGLGMAGYGLLTRTRALIDNGLRLVAIAAVLFAIGWWYFEGWFATGEQPFDPGAWWPVALIVAGAIVAARAVIESRRPRAAG